MEQKIYRLHKNYDCINEWIDKNGIKKVFLVAGKSIKKHEELMKALEILKAKGLIVKHFSDFEPNPEFISFENGLKTFGEEKYDSIIAVGGGSAIDVAKCIRLYASNENNIDIPFMAIPTTAGTGSEATRFAVIYKNGVKQSVTDDKCLPDTVLLDADLLKSLPSYQRKVTMMDALSHSVESYLSIRSNELSQSFCIEAIGKILKYKNEYQSNSEVGNREMLEAAFLAGKAINITTTMAGHAMSYKLTKMFDIAHGHAVAICNAELLYWMVNNLDKCRDERGKEYLKLQFDNLAKVMGGESAKDLPIYFKQIVSELDLKSPIANEFQIKELVGAVNEERLKNTPIELDTKDIEELYRRIVGEEK